MTARDAAASPATIAAEIIEAIRAAVDRGQFDDLPLRQRLERGEQPLVRFNGSGIVGKLIGLDEAGRAAVLLRLLGRDVVTRVPLAPLEFVAAE